MRRCRRNPDVGRIEQQIRLARRLAEGGVPTPAVRGSRDGRDVVCVDGLPWFVTEHVEGRRHDHRSRAEAVAAGRSLGRLHAAWCAVDEAEVEAPANWCGLRWWRDPGAVLDRLARRFAPVAPAELRLLVACTADAPAAALVHDLPRGWIHADYHGANLLFARGEVVAVLDFDVCHRDALVFDVARAVAAFARSSPPATNLRPEAARAFLDGYRAVRPLTPAEQALLPQAAVVACLRDVAYYDMVRRDGEDDVAAFRHHVGLAAARRSQRAALLEVATDP